MDGNNERLLTPGEVAELFRVDPKTVTRWAASGRITSIRTPGGHRRFRETEIRSLLRGDNDPSTECEPGELVAAPANGINLQALAGGLHLNLRQALDWARTRSVHYFGSSLGKVVLLPAALRRALEPDNAELAVELGLTPIGDIRDRPGTAA